MADFSGHLTMQPDRYAAPQMHHEHAISRGIETDGYKMKAARVHVS